MDNRVKLTYISFFRNNFIVRDGCLDIFVKPETLLEDLVGGKPWFYKMSVLTS
jgi:hypothetical protein